MSPKPQVLFGLLSSQLVLEISETPSEHKGNHPKSTLDKYLNVWLILKLFLALQKRELRENRKKEKMKWKERKGRITEKNRGKM